MVTDVIGNVYVADYNNSRVQEFNSSGGYISQFSGTSPLYLYGCDGLAINGIGQIYVGTINYGYTILKFDSSGNYLQALPLVANTVAVSPSGEGLWCCWHGRRLQSEPFLRFRCLGFRRLSSGGGYGCPAPDSHLELRSQLTADAT